MNRATTLAICLVSVLLMATGTAIAASNGSVETSPTTEGQSAQHTVTATVGLGSSGSWTGLSVDYTGTGADPSGISEAAISVVGIDRGDDAPGATVDVDASNDVASVSLENDEQRVVIELEGDHSIKNGDEVVVRYGPGIRNPPVAGDNTVPIQINPGSSGGQTTALLQVGSNRATVLFDDQPTAGQAVEIESVRVPNGGFVVLHDKEELERSGAAESVVGHSNYLEPGSHNDVGVMLTDTVRSGGQYVAMAHKDDGNQRYDFPDGDAAYSVQGNPVVETAVLTLKTPPSTQAQEPATSAGTTSTPSTEGADQRAGTGTGTTGGDSPGFGVVLAVLSVVCVVVLGLRRS